MKILFAVNSNEISTPALDFAAYVAKLTKSALTGVFLENTEFEELYTSDDEAEKEFIELVKSVDIADIRKRRSECDKAIAHFKEACTVRETPCKVHRDKGIPFDELILESRYADVLIIDASFSIDGNENMLSNFVQKVLARAECPVLIPPAVNTMIDRVFVAYDGSASSVYALKHFAYLFSELRDKKLTVLQVTSEGTHLTERHKLTEWIKEYFADFDFLVKEGDEEKALLDSIIPVENCLIIMGAFGRNAISRLFIESHGKRVLDVTDQPLFISHL